MECKQHMGRSRRLGKSQPPQGFCAVRPNQVWSWDVTRPSRPIRGMFYSLYIIVDIYSRKITGCEVQPVEAMWLNKPQEGELPKDYILSDAA